MKTRHVVAIAMIAGLSMLSAGVASAEIIVLTSKGGPLKPGETLTEGATIDLPAGASAEILLPSGSLRTLTGPVKTTVAALTKGQKPDAGLFGKVSEIVGNTGQRENVVGAVRAARPVARSVSRPASFSWRNIPIDADGDYCVEKGAGLMLVRPPSDKPASVTVVDVAGSARAAVAFAAGSPTAAWPETVTPKVGSYGLLTDGRPMKQIRLRLISPLPERGETIRLLHSQRCELQMRAFLAELTQVAGR